MGAFGQGGRVAAQGCGSSPALGNWCSMLSAPEDRLSGYAWHKGPEDGGEAKALPCTGGAVLRWVTAGLESDEGISA